jgi:CubicO group peptidase (beta-lactamase class C family)
MDQATLKDLLNEIDRRGLAIDSVLVLRHGTIVLEQYYRGSTVSSTHDLYSVTKSFVSALVGMAIDQGVVQGVEQKALDFFPGRTFANPDPRKAAMTVENILTMSTGLQWNEGDPEYQALYVSGDWVANMFNRPIVVDPGSRFNYCSGCTHLLASIVQQATKTNVKDFAKKYLFQPLGIDNFIWDTNPQGEAIGGWGLKLAPRDMARLGYLYLHQGSWNGQQILSPSWIETSTRSHISTGDGSYGYQWWIYPDLNAYAAQGRYGQMIFVQPKSDLVVVFTATIDGLNPELDLIKSYIIPAIK